jgi:hypothetical protein
MHNYENYSNYYRRWTAQDTLDQRRRRAAQRAVRMARLRSNLRCGYCGAAMPDAERVSRRFCGPACRSAAGRLAKLQAARAIFEGER